MSQYQETMSMRWADIIVELLDMGVDVSLVNAAVTGGSKLTRALYLFVMEEAANA